MTTTTVARHDAPARRRPTGPRAVRSAADRLELAIALAARGFAVFPLRPDSKVPAVRGDWEGLASADPARLRARGWPANGNVGIACGPSDLFVLDLDIAKDTDAPAVSAAVDEPREGAKVLRDLAAGRPIPPTLTVATPSGGTHLYFRAEPSLRLRNTVARLGPLIDTRAAGGYVVGPGSTVAGRRYEIIVDLPIAPVPRWIVVELAGRHQTEAPSTPPAALGRPDLHVSQRAGSAAAYAAAALRNEAERVLTARVGARNDTLNRAAYALGRLIGAGQLDRDQATTELFIAARRNGLPAREAASTLASGLGAGIGRPRPPAAPYVARKSPRTEYKLEPAGAVRASVAAASSIPASTITALKAVERAYDAAALCAAPLVSDCDWRRIRTLVDVLRDLRDSPRPAPSDARHAASLCARIAGLAETLAQRCPAPGRKRARSPLGKALRALRRAADAAHAELVAGEEPADESIEP
ncbi:MAG: bifunctional DNA primase/polymerase [Actinocrinis sp.]